MLKIHESYDKEGRRTQVHLAAAAGGLPSLCVVDDQGTFELPEEALPRVMERYGAPLDPDAPTSKVASMDLGAGRRLVHVRHLQLYDVIARDYLAFERPDHEPLCALATTVAAALGHLGRRAAER